MIFFKRHILNDHNANRENIFHLIRNLFVLFDLLRYFSFKLV
jgi:hypothetical protein